jgi:hypothetical protein
VSFVSENNVSRETIFYCFVLKPAALQRDLQNLNNGTTCVALFISGLSP